jgi:hypothetical protein
VNRLDDVRYAAVFPKRKYPLNSMYLDDFFGSTLDIDLRDIDLNDL